MNLFKIFKKYSSSKKENLFSFNFYVDTRKNIFLDFKASPNQSLNIAEFLFKLRNDEDMWLAFYNQMSANMSTDEFSIFKNHLLKLYTDYAKNINELIKQISEDSNEPLISPSAGFNK